MTRRGFLRLFAPVAAVPTLAIASEPEPVASEPSIQTGMTFHNCTFNMTRPMALQGENITISYCDFKVGFEPVITVPVNDQTDYETFSPYRQLHRI